MDVDDQVRNLLDMAARRVENVKDKGLNWADPSAWPTPHRHYNDVRECEHGERLDIGILEILQEAEYTQQLMDFVGVPDGHEQGGGDSDWRVARAVIRLLDAEARLAAIVSAHSREHGEGGLVGDYCVECSWKWPCPTYRWANGDVENSAVDAWDDERADAPR